MKKTLALLFCIVQLSYAQIQSPKQFLGMEVGDRFYPTQLIYKYAEHIAQQKPAMVKWVNYGKTYEQRDLMMMIVSSEENMKNLDQYRTDHLKSIGMMEGKPTGKARPPFVWMSYNVHGDEAVNTQSVPKTLYELLSDNPISQKILKNNVVIIVPCVNPDGHDRYANWYNQKVSTSPNPSPVSWEHSQPWPGGRYNHYLFDPNRDWAWQTQEITKQLIAAYHQWMPQVHGDFHEMGHNSPYYFAPAAKPFHEDISTWQRELQDIIGSYNKKYFDRNSWLYYTRERFDLFYPSYGDTWPTYNGAIGMTYEQGGGGFAGLAIERPDEGDTLTLRDRIAHVTAASIGTLESIADRPAKVVEEFVRYFEKSQTNPIGQFKSYVIKRAGDEGKVKALCELLDKNKIVYGWANQTKDFNGYSYQNNKDEAFKMESNDLIISAYQPKSTLLKILFETKPVLEDSVTYDITSWCVPLAYGLRAYGLKEKMTGSNNKPADALNKVSGKPYAYLATWRSVEDAKFLAALHNHKIRPRVAEKSFEIGGKTYQAGTLIITRTSNERLGDKFDKIIVEEANKRGIALTATETGGVTNGSDFGSDFVYTVKAPRVGLIAGEGTSNLSVADVWYLFDQELNYPITLIDPNASGRGSAGNFLSRLDVLVVPSSFGSSVLRDPFLSSVKDWVRGGGRLILLENATSALADKEGFGLKTKKAGDKKPNTDSLKTYGARERDAVMNDSPGSIYKITMDNTHPLAFGFGNSFHVLINNFYNYDFLKDGGWNVGYLRKEKESYVAGFTGKNVKDKMQNSMIYGVEDMGRGKIVYMPNNPNFRGFWYNGKLLFANAVFMLP